MRPSAPSILRIAAVAAVTLAGIFVLWQALAAAPEEPGFPLDDPWIHLQFARNLAEHGSFSYWEDRQVTSGSTAPLYTLLLAAGLRLGADPFALAYGLGAAFLLASGLLARRLGRDLGGGAPAGLAAGLLTVAEPRLVWAALSGMETTLFTALLLAALACWRERRAWGLGVASGLLLWTRPEAVIMLGALGAAFAYDRVVRRREDGAPAGPAPGRPLLLAAILAAGYAAFNLALSGSLLPNTYAAKLTYYAGGGRGFGGQLLAFLLGGAGPVVLPLAAAGAAATLVAVDRRRPAPLLAPLLWCAGLVAAYWWKLPYLYQHGRYLMPVLPFLALLAVGGLRALPDLAPLRAAAARRPRGAAGVRASVLALAGAWVLVAAWQERGTFGADSAYIGARQVATARWIDANLPPDAVVATHDVGALAWYSGRRIVDMVGLVSPEVIEDIGDFEQVKAHLARQGATHVAVLTSWYLLDNVRPVFRTDAERPEIMEVRPFDAERLHRVAPSARRLAVRGERALAAGDAERATRAFTQAVAADPEAASLRYARGRALLEAGRAHEAVQAFRAAARLQPTLWDARFAVASLTARGGEPARAIALLEALVRDNPRYARAYKALAQLHRDARNDPEEAARWLRRWRQVGGGAN